MIDENAFGLLVSLWTIENDEYALSREEFAAKAARFHDLVLAQLEHDPPGEGLRVLELGHATYIEVAEGDEIQPIEWLRQMRERLGESGCDSVCVLSHGSRWVEDDGTDDERSLLDAPGEEESLPALTRADNVVLCRFAFSSEPLRRALFVETASHDDDDLPGWGAGLYADVEAIEALGKRLKNSPTGLRVAGATFFRLGA